MFFNVAATIKIRNVPNWLHRRLKSGAARAGKSLSDYLLGELRQVAERPTLDELRARLKRRPGIIPSVTPEQAMRAERGLQ
jgi:plasmid stability protein